TEHISTTLGVLAADMGAKDSIALNVLEVRLAIEIESAGLAAIRRNAAQEAAIQEAFFEFERLLLASQPTGPADIAFHRAIASATNNPLYVEMLDVLGRRAIPCDVTSPWSAELVQADEYQRGLQREHLVILNEISAGDAEAAREAMRAHLTSS
ncbi:MAG: FadR family transcriptional regulator, partial [Mesorhizobium sp.]